ncbi:MAG: sulfite exporter TauE/SafE family protein [Clostridia bacterium]|nr:sulfite exporter TauE/SafE family protein [Clostridia bacterium]
MLKKVSVGFIAGIVCGMFGAGGGMILVPAFTHLFKIDEKKSRATSVFAILPMILVGIIFYTKANHVDIEIGLRCAFGGLVGGLIGAKMLKKASNNTLKIIFIFFISYSSIKMIFF